MSEPRTASHTGEGGSAERERLREADVGDASALEREVEWCKQALNARLEAYFSDQDGAGECQLPAAPALGLGSPYGELVDEHCLDDAQRLILILSLLPHLQPQALDLLFVRNNNLDRGFTEFGGWRGSHHGGFLPTAETAVFLLAGANLPRRVALAPLLSEAGTLVRERLLRSHHGTRGEPPLATPLAPTADCLQRISTGERQALDYSIDFPAQQIRTALCWDDLVLSPEVQSEIDTVRAWLTHGETILRDWGLGRALKPGYRALFYGPPGTGKTLAATLLGQVCEREVYRIDLANVVSKYIGETEKNLATVFDQARDKRWILFFDEADALFGKRTETSSAHDRYANQEVSYLLQRIEEHPGVAILASNLRGNIDDAFTRRFQSVAYFAVPDAEQRLALWQRLLSGGYKLAKDVDLASLADSYELAGGAIANVARHGAIAALKTGAARVGQAHLLEGIARELRKEGKAMQQART